MLEKRNVNINYHRLICFVVFSYAFPHSYIFLKLPFDNCTFVFFSLGWGFCWLSFLKPNQNFLRKTASAKVVMSVLTSVLYLACLPANGLLLALIARFKSLRTVPNIFVANLAVVDLLSGAINMPLYTISYEWEARWF